MLTTREVVSRQQDLNRFEVAAIPKALRNQGRTTKIYTVNTKRFAPMQLGSLGTFTLPVCEPGEEVSKPLEIPGIVLEGIPVDMRKIEHRTWDGEEVAKDILGIGAFKHASQDMRRYGFFIAEGDRATKAEIAEAKAQLAKRYQELVEEADALHMQGPLEAKNISSNHQEARIALKLERDWGKGVSANIECPACGKKLAAHVAICGGNDGCGVVIDEQKVIALKLPKYEHLWQKEPKEKKTA